MLIATISHAMRLKRLPAERTLPFDKMAGVQHQADQLVEVNAVAQ